MQEKSKLQLQRAQELQAAAKCQTYIKKRKILLKRNHY